MSEDCLRRCEHIVSPSRTPSSRRAHGARQHDFFAIYQSPWLSIPVAVDVLPTDTNTVPMNSHALVSAGVKELVALIRRDGTRPDGATLASWQVARLERDSDSHAGLLVATAARGPVRWLNWLLRGNATNTPTFQGPIIIATHDAMNTSAYDFLS